MSLKVGVKAPDFTTKSTDGQEFNLYKNQQNKVTVLYFYPKDFTRGCTKEACSFRDAFDVLKGLDVDVYGISKDTYATHVAFKKEYNLPYHLLEDQDQKIAKLYKAHYPIINLTKRITYVLDRDLKIVSSYDDLLGAENHIKQVIKQLKV
jgi:peroxiredoxin Q/BCP